jgi:YfiH family protein
VKTSPSISRYVSEGVTLLGDTGRPGGVTFAFTERGGGVSEAPYASLNLGGACGDVAERVHENRRRALAALGAASCADRLVMPNQVHGDEVVVIHDATDAELSRVRDRADAGADAIVCLAREVPVMLCFADCVPVVLAAPGAFAVVHSGWRGTLARISGKAMGVLCEEAGCEPSVVKAYIGPHITGEDYVVSPELLDSFVNEFGSMVNRGRDRLDLASAIQRTLTSVGARPCNLLDSNLSTARGTDRFYSYRAEGGTCGRHAAMAFMPYASS